MKFGEAVAKAFDKIVHFRLRSGFEEKYFGITEQVSRKIAEDQNALIAVLTPAALVLGFALNSEQLVGGGFVGAAYLFIFFLILLSYSAYLTVFR